MKQFRIVFKNGFYIDHKAELIEWPKTCQSKMLYLYNDHRKPIGRFNINNIAAVIYPDIMFTNINSILECDQYEVMVGRRTYCIQGTKSNYIPDTNTLAIIYKEKTQALINLNVAYGYYMEEGNYEKQVQVGRESNDN